MCSLVEYRMESFSPKCAAQSAGPTNQLFTTLFQTILAAHCSISPPEMWPRDYGESALENGNIYRCISL